MKSVSGLNIIAKHRPLGFEYGQGVFGPVPEIRRLEDIRASLQDPNSQGPEELYCISMDVGFEKDRADLLSRNLLFGIVTYSAGRIGQETIRSQGHAHGISKSCNSSTCEVYEIWEGEACIFMQERNGDSLGTSYAIFANPGDVVIVPPNWIHATINANENKSMTFGAWCVRDYCFDYKTVRENKGISYFPKLKEGKISWERNLNYIDNELVIKKARTYPEFNIDPGVPIYTQYEKNRDLFNFVKDPLLISDIWEKFIP